MKGQIAIVLLVLFLVTGVIAFLIVSLFFLPLLKTVVSSTILPSSAVGAITALLGFLPDQCSVLSSLECRFCLITNKILPLVVNTVFGIVLFSILLRYVGKPRLGWHGHEQAEGGIAKGLIKDYGSVLLISLAFSIFMLHQENPLGFLNIGTMFLAIIVRIVSFLVEIEGIEHIRRLSDFFLAANILVSGWDNLWWIPITFIAGFTIATAVEKDDEGGHPFFQFDLLSFIVLSVFLLIVGFYLFGIFEHQWPTPFGSLPTKIEFKGLASYIAEKANLQEIKCGSNKIGPDSTISF